MKTKLALAVLLAISTGVATSAFAQTLTVSPNPVCVGQPVTVSLSGVCSEGGASATVNGHTVTLTDNGSGNWSGTYTTTTSDDGTVSCSASDNCNDTFNSVSLTVVSCHYEVFVRQPYPDYPNDSSNYGPYGPPLGYPVYNLGASDAGHAWWKISTDAPINIINQCTTTNCSKWMNVETGYGPQNPSINYWYFFLLLQIDKQGPGMVYGGSTGATVHRTYVVGFQNKGVINGVNQVEWLSNNPGVWDSQYNNCVDETVVIGVFTGVHLPLSDTTPEGFGFNLPPDTQ